MEKWFIKNKGIDYREIARKLNISSIISKILVNRGIYTEDSIDIFLNSSIEKMHPPSQMKDLVKAGDLLKNKIDNGKSIRIVGDYDVDGIMSVYLLYRAFKDLGAKVDYIIPNRVSEGYGLNVEIV
ncbi:MAG TPA: DHH family phosphoesterase, partial [Tissierellaceae bacterium]|nr:DHH family phosphoesterase [Tissierellaceae bacterium]